MSLSLPSFDHAVLTPRSPGVLPGLALCLAVTLAAVGLQQIEARLFGRAWLESVAMAILLGAVVRYLWIPGPAWTSGIEFSAKTLLEIAVVLLGAGMDVHTIIAVGAPLLAGIAVLVALAISAGYGLGRAFRLPRRMAMLIACGNAICGNSAIAAVAPVIGADGEDVAAAIAFTAALGVGVVIGLPLMAPMLHMDHQAFGLFAGLTVYAVPQVLAATVPISPLSSQVGAVVKLARVLMLGPVVAVLSLLTLKDRDEADEAAPAVTAGDRPRPGRPALHQLVPWFIVGFLLMIGLRSMGWLPPLAARPAASAANGLTIVSMAALGLGVDVRALARAGARVSAVVALSLATLAALALMLIHAVTPA